MRPKENAQTIQHAQGFTTTVAPRDITNALRHLTYPLRDVALLSIQKVITIPRYISLLNERPNFFLGLCHSEKILILSIYYFRKPAHFSQTNH